MERSKLLNFKIRESILQNGENKGFKIAIKLKFKENKIN